MDDAPCLSFQCQHADLPWGLVLCPVQYVWLNDDVHGVNGPHATVFPDGCGLGAAFDKDLMHEVGLALGLEVRYGWRPRPISRFQ